MKLNKKLQQKLAKKLRKMADDVESEPLPPRMAAILGDYDPPKRPAVALRQGALLQVVSDAGIPLRRDKSPQ